MATVGGIGVGLIILAVIWVLCLLSCIVLSRAQGAIANAGIASVLVAIIITLILWFFPRGPDDEEKDYTVYDDMYQARTAIISILGIMLAIGLVLAGLFHSFDLQRAVYIKKGKVY